MATTVTVVPAVEPVATTSRCTFSIDDLAARSSEADEPSDSASAIIRSSMCARQRCEAVAPPWPSQTSKNSTASPPIIVRRVTVTSSPFRSR